MHIAPPRFSRQTKLQFRIILKRSSTRWGLLPPVRRSWELQLRIAPSSLVLIISCTSSPRVTVSSEFLRLGGGIYSSTLALVKSKRSSHSAYSIFTSMSPSSEAGTARNCSRGCFLLKTRSLRNLDTIVQACSCSHSAPSIMVYLSMSLRTTTSWSLTPTSTATRE